MQKRRRIRWSEGEDDRRYAGERRVTTDDAGEREHDEQRGEDGEKEEIRHLRRFADEIVLDESACDIASQRRQALELASDDRVQSG